MTQHAEDRYGELLELGNGRAVVRYRRRLLHPRDAVWRALTEEEHLATWFPTTADGERAEGAALTFRFVGVDIPPMTGTIRVFEPPAALELSWGDDVLRFELEPAGGAETVLTLVVTMAEPGKAARDGAGWHVCLDDLEADLAGRDAEPADRWREVNSVYIARFGPEASTVGPPEALTS